MVRTTVAVNLDEAGDHPADGIHPRDGGSEREATDNGADGLGLNLGSDIGEHGYLLVWGDNILKSVSSTNSSGNFFLSALRTRGLFSSSTSLGDSDGQLV